MTIQERLRYARQRVGLTQQQAADHLKIARSTYSGYEKDSSNGYSRNLSMNQLRELSLLYNVDANWLIGTTNEFRTLVVEKSESLDGLSRRIRELRKSRGLKISELARAISVDPLEMALWEEGKEIPIATHPQMLADFFGVSLDYLYGRSNDPLTSEERQRRANEEAAGQD